MNDQSMTTPNPKEPKNPRKRRIWPYLVILSMVVLAVFVRVSMRAQWVHNIVKNQIEIQGSKAIHGDIRLDHLHGDLWNDITLSGFTLTDSDGNNVVAFDSLKLRYSIFSLFSEAFRVDHMLLYKPEVGAVQTSEDSWNLLELVPESSEPAEAESSVFAIDIRRVGISDGRIDIFSSYLLPDTTLSIRGIQMESAFSMRKDAIGGELKSLSLSLKEGRLNQPVSLDMAATYEDQVLTLDRLALSTGATFLEIAARIMESGEEVSLNAMLEPLSWRDVLAYTEEPFFVQDVELSLGLEGSFEQWSLKAGVKARGLEYLNIGIEGAFADDLIIRSVQIDAGKTDLAVFTGNPEFPSFGRISSRFDGLIAASDTEQARLSGYFEMRDFAADIYALDVFRLEGRLEEERLTSEILLRLGNQRIQSSTVLADIYSEIPQWEVAVNSRGLNPAVWLRDPELDADLNLNISVRGSGFEPGRQAWLARGTLTQSRWGEQAFQTLSFDARITEKDVSVNGLLNLVESELRLKADISDWQQEEMHYAFDLGTTGFNLAELNGLEEFPTQLNLQAQGSGSGIDPETMTVTAQVSMDQSVVNGALIDRLNTNLRLRNAILEFTDTRLESTLAEGYLSVYQHIFDLDNPDNEIRFDLSLLDLQPLAPLFNAEVLHVRGNTTGTFRISQGLPNLDTSLSLTEIRYDSLYLESLSGVARARFSEVISFSADVEARQALYEDFELQRLALKANGEVTADTVRGLYSIEVDMSPTKGIVNKGNFNVMPDSLDVDIFEFSLFKESFRLDLRDPFQMQFVNELITLHPLTLQDNSGLEIHFEVAQYAARAFRGSLSTRNVELYPIQQILMEEAFIAGLMDGEIRFDIDLDESHYDFNSDLSIAGFEYQNFRIDSMRLLATIENEELDVRYNAIRGGQDFISLTASIPFQPGDPIGFEDDFFERPVRGSFHLNPFELSRETEFLEAVGLEGIAGMVSARGSLSGKAGSPQMGGDFKLVNGRFANVAVDSLGFGWEYRHDRSDMGLSATLVSSGQRAADLQGSFPLLINWRTFEVAFDNPDQVMDIRVQSNQFDMASLNQFADRDVVRQITGRIGADLQVRGNPAEPQVTGFFRVQNSSMYLVQNNITLRSIDVDMLFGRDRIQVRNLSAQSTGTFRGNGNIRLNGFVPESFDIRLTARNFRAMDTRDAQAFVSFDTRLDGSVNSPKVTGEFSLERGFLYLDNFGEATVEEVILEDEQSSGFEDMDFWNNLRMEMKISTERNFWVRNRSRPEIQLQLNGELDLVKYAGEDIQVFGTMGANQGFVNQFGKRFVLERGDLTFSGPPENPELQIRTLYALRQPSDIKIWYVIEGTAQDPIFIWESDPQMELQDIVSYTVFGRPFHALMAWEQNVSGRSDAGVADAALDILLDRVEQLATERLGIDVLEIDNTRSGGNPGTSIKAGKFISDRLFVAILQELGSTVSSQVMVEYQLRRNLNVMVTGSDSYQTGVDVVWKYDY